MSTEPSEPTFASPTPPGSMPAGDLDAARLPGAPVPAPRDDGAVPAVAETVLGPDGGPTAAMPESRTRRRAAVAVVGVAVIAFVAAAVVLASQAALERSWEPLPATLEEPTQAHAVQLVLGSCITELPDDGLVHQVQAVPCGDPHEAQVVGRTDASPDTVWPGDDDAAARTSRACGPDLLGPAAREAGAAQGLRFVVWAPSEESWADGDRTGLCLAVTSEPRTGSLLE